MSPRANTISSRRKSCFACVRGKRRCDLGFPQCDRCLSRRVTCVYAWISPEEAQEIAQSASLSPRITQQIRHDDHNQRGVTETPLWNRYLPGSGDSHTNDTATFGSAIMTPLSLAPAAVPLLDEITGRGRILSYLGPDVQFQCSNGPHLNADSILHATQPLNNIGVPTTSLQIANAGDSSIVTSRIFRARSEYAASRLVLQATALAETGQTVFIHHSHIDASPILRDALATCSLWSIRNSANSSLIWSEIARRAELLVQATETAISFTSPGPHSAMNLDLLPAVQAMLLYQAMRIFSTADVAQQAQAELDAKSLARWVGILQTHSQWSFNINADGAQFDLSAWKDWVQAESLRRTLVLAELLDSLWTYLRFGWYRASETMTKLCFTGQAALWEAKSAAEWYQAGWRKLWFEINMSKFHVDMEAALPDDLDELGIIIRASYDGIEALKEWLGGDSRLLEKLGLSSRIGYAPAYF